MTSTGNEFTSVEICAGAGGQALGLERAGFEHALLIEMDKSACDTLRHNRPQWEVHEGDLRDYVESEAAVSLASHIKIDLLAGGVPCPPFSLAGKQLGRDDERDLFPTMIKLARQLDPSAIMIENVRGLMQSKFDSYRKEIIAELEGLGYECDWQELQAGDFGVSQLRPRSILVALKPRYWKHFNVDGWYLPPADQKPALSVGHLLSASMRERGLEGKAFEDWFEKASTGIAPTLVGGSKKHGGADLGPTRAKKAWADLGVCGLGVADEPDEETGTTKNPSRDLGTGTENGPMLTVPQAAMIQGFTPESGEEQWEFMGRKTAAYRQVGNAFPPPVAKAVGVQIKKALEAHRKQAGVLSAHIPAPADSAHSEDDLVSAPLR
ncbi:DNA (cytosine-5-)-methyltransferase [Streptomyces sp. NBC_01221]|uniref:DNA cytosine methyltransferase n=1 Tax=unclassified Streptomyces TaxID=2593676 RepID=UPI0022575E19|nr:DNA (cytosine-5-)-methyltransferase [Streptomyces sp. NBC_01221]MCX4786932.1 DNA (cytosine-5-)-methyltransferase [Streptomyces sp. NBC_01221]